MAVRSGAGTGVVVSLVVFILTTFFLLVLTIVFYSKQTKALEAKANAENTLATWVKPAERNSESFMQFEDAAKKEGESVARHMQGQVQEIMSFTHGAPNTTVTELKTAFQTLEVGEGDVVKDKLRDARRTLKDAQEEIDRKNTQLETWRQDNAEMKAQVEQLERSHQQRLDELQAQINEYREAAVTYRQEVDDLKADMRTSRDELVDQYEREKRRLRDELDQLSEDRVVLIDRIDELESKIRQDQIAPPDPSLLVDGGVIDTEGRADQVYIDRGHIHHVVLGMTFEVYDDAAALRLVNRETGELPRGKASIEVIKVGEKTSTCKVVRSVPGRPVVRGDVLANAVYDPSYKFRFLVHGKFDVDGDGRPTESEAEYLRSLVTDWGGEIVTGEDLPGDLDFLVVGVEPQLVTDLPDNAPPHVVDLWVQRRKAYEIYHRLLQQARDAQIPVLNANRFFILTGYTVR